MTRYAAAVWLGMMAFPGAAAGQVNVPQQPAPAVRFGPTPWLGGQPIEVWYPTDSTNAIHASRFSVIRQYTDAHTGRPRPVRRGLPLFYRRW